jgi:antitoxin YefM
MAEAVTMKEVFDELKKIERNMVTKEEMEALVDTIEIMSNPHTMKQIAQSEEDIKRGRVKTVHSVKDMLSEI